MAGITLEQAESKLTAYLVVEEKIFVCQMVDMDGRWLIRADLSAVQQGIAIWNRRVNKLSRNSRTRIVEGSAVKMPHLKIKSRLVSQRNRPCNKRPKKFFRTFCEYFKFQHHIRQVTTPCSAEARASADFEKCGLIPCYFVLSTLPRPWLSAEVTGSAWSS